MRQFIKSLIPAEWLVKYHRRRKRKQTQARAAKRNAAPTLTPGDLCRLLAELGVKSGDMLMVHSALGQFNNIEGGGKGAVEAIRSVLGPEGTLVVPTFPHWGTTMRTGAAFNEQETPSMMGVITELVRRNPDARRSLHPTHSIAAIGPLAAELTAGHEASAFAFGKDSPFYKLATGKAKVLLLGVDFNSLTAFHIFEDLIGIQEWLPVYEKHPRSFGITDRYGQKFTYTGYFHDLKFAASRDVERLRRPLKKVGGLRTASTGYSELCLLDLPRFVVLCLEEISEGRSGYSGLTVPESEKPALTELANAYRKALL